MTVDPTARPRRTRPSLPRLALYAIGLPLLLAAALALHTWYFRPLSIDWFFARLTLQRLLDDPEALTTARILEPWGIRAHNGRLTDISPAATEARQRASVEALATLHGYDRSALSPGQQSSYDVLEVELRDDIEDHAFRYHHFPINQTGGMQTELPDLLINFQQIDDAADAELYLKRLSAFPTRFATVRADLEIAQSRHIQPPRFMVDAVLVQLREFTAPPPRRNALYLDFARKLAAVPAGEIDARTRARLLADAERTIAQSVYPAYAVLTDWFTRQQPTLARNDGAWSLPDGARYYAHCIARHTDTRLGAEELHALGLAEVARIGAQMDALLRREGYPEGTIGARMRALAASPSQQYPDTPAGRAAILAEYRRIVTAAMPVLRRQFAQLPRAEVQVQPVPGYAEASAPVGYYYSPAMDGSTPGIFYVNLGNVADLPRLSMPTLTYHEAVPGHHFQQALAQEREDLPLFRKMAFFTAYVEGWALYAEQLAAELGLVRTPTDELGRLQSEMFRAVRLVVDTGMHAKRWSREQSIAYMIDQTGMGDREVSSEIERYLVDPGQALAYKVGMMKILELRAHARQALGPRFDIRAFHAAVLDEGAVPLSVLTQQVDRYIARAHGAPATNGHALPRHE